MASQEDAWALEYGKLRASGLGHREAIHRIAGYKGRRGKGGSHIPLEAVEWGIQHARARLRRQGKLLWPKLGSVEQTAQRRGEIVRLAEEGLDRRTIADRLGLSYPWVYTVLKKAGATVADRRRTSERG